MGGGVKSRLVKESVEYLRQKAEKATALKCAQFINSLLLQLQARVATSLSSDSQILWKKPTPAAQLLTLHCTVLDAASGKQQALDYRGGEDDRLPYMTDQNGWPHVYEDADLVPCFSNTGANTRGKVEKLMEQWGDGARAIVRVQWKGGNSGHVFIAERENGLTRFVDPQVNDGDCSRYFAEAKKNKTYCMRVDDRKFTDLINQCCKEKR